MRDSWTDDEATYEALDARLGSRDSRKIGNNTYLQRRGPDEIAVKLHATDVVTYHRDGSLVLDSGGWLTITTKDRMNRCSPWQVWSERGRWFVGSRSHASADSSPYFDGIRLSEDGIVLNRDAGPDHEKEDRENRVMRRRIAAYVKLYTDERIAELVASTETGKHRGDCFMCQMRDPNDRGAEVMGTDHLLSHLDESYTMVSVILNALYASGYRDYQIPVVVRVPDLVRRAIGKYLRKRLLQGVAVTV